MDEEAMIDDLVKLLDDGVMQGTGHINVDVDSSQKTTRQVQTMGCTDCSKVPLACCVPTLEEGLDDFPDKK